MTLTQEQQKAYEDIVNSTDKVIVLLGLAGSGKSTLVSYLANNYNGKVALTATTNKAKTLLENKTNKPATTIHSFCGFLMTKNNKTMKLSKVIDSNSSDLIIVDEVSMLTNDVFKELLKCDVKKILLVGDLLQLPAIGDSVDLSKYKTIYLTKNIRQENSEVSAFMELLRNSVSKKRAIRFSEEELPKDIIVYESHKEFCKTYKECKNQKRILAYSNKVVDSYNLNINSGIAFKVGDLLVLDKPLNRYAKNGDIVEVKQVLENEDRFMLVVSFKNYSDTIMVFKSKTKENEFFSQLGDDNDLFWYYKDLTFSPKLIYASTIHKAQGDTIDEVFVDLRDIYSQLQRRPTQFNNYNQPISVDEYLKLVYVAISRMRLKAHIFIGEKRNYKELHND